MGEGLLTVEEVVHRLNVTPRTLHYYEEMGLIRPTRRTEGGHRLYNEAVLERLQYILHLKEHLGLPLQEIRSLLDAEETLEQLGVSYKASPEGPNRDRILDEFITVLETQTERIDDKIRKLKTLRTRFSERLERANAKRNGVR